MTHTLLTYAVLVATAVTIILIYSVLILRRCYKPAFRCFYTRFIAALVLYLASQLADAFHHDLIMTLLQLGASVVYLWAITYHEQALISVRKVRR